MSTSMKTYYVSVPEVWYRTFVVEAENEEQATLMVREDPAPFDQLDLEFSHDYHNGEIGFYEVREVTK